MIASKAQHFSRGEPQRACWTIYDMEIFVRPIVEYVLHILGSTTSAIIRVVSSQEPTAAARAKSGSLEDPSVTCGTKSKATLLQQAPHGGST